MKYDERDYDLLESIFRTPFNLVVTDAGFSIDDLIYCRRIYESGELVVIYATFKKGGVYPIHCHNNSAEHFVCVSGKLEISIYEGNDLSVETPIVDVKILEPTECLSIAAATKHSVKALQDSVVVAVCIPPELAYCKADDK